MRPIARRPAVVSALLALTLASPLPAQAEHTVEAGTGWQNTGAIRDGLHWLPGIQGSRKDVPAFAGWRWTGTRRFYWAPSARLVYTNYWSIGGGGNALGVYLAPAGIGVYLTRPPSEIAGSRRGRWFATVELSVGAQIGGNLTPDQPATSEVPDPPAYRARLQAEYNAKGGIDAASVITQHYPGGAYSFASIAVPIRISAWNMVNERVGVGFFLEGNGLMLEWDLAPGATRTPAYGYNIVAGLSAVLF